MDRPHGTITKAKAQVAIIGKASEFARQRILTGWQHGQPRSHRMRRTLPAPQHRGKPGGAPPVEFPFKRARQSDSESIAVWRGTEIRQSGGLSVGKLGCLKQVHSDANDDEALDGFEQNSCGLRAIQQYVIRPFEHERRAGDKQPSHCLVQSQPRQQRQ